MAGMRLMIDEYENEAEAIDMYNKQNAYNTMIFTMPW
jgi:hypothetical protein